MDHSCPIVGVGGRNDSHIILYYDFAPKTSTCTFPGGLETCDLIPSTCTITLKNIGSADSVVFEWGPSKQGFFIDGNGSTEPIRNADLI